MRLPLNNDTPEPDKQPVSKIESPATVQSDEVEVPYTDYQSKNNHPYVVDYFQLGDTWEDPTGGFPNEVSLIESYVQDKIRSGEIANSVSAIKNTLKDMEKFNNLTKEERSVVKIEVLSHYVEFLQKNEQTKQNLRRYNGAV